MSLVETLLACSGPPTGTSGDATELRRQAEQRLAEAERRDAQEFVLACASVLQDRSAPPYARHLAGILLKNAVAAGHDHGPRSRHLATRWLAMAIGVKARVREAVLETLIDSTDAGARRAAALCIARIGALDVPKGAWNEVVPKLVSLAHNMHEGTYQAEEAVRALGFLAEEWCSHQVREIDVVDASEQILVVAVRGLDCGQVSIRVAAARAFHAILPFTSNARLRRNDPTEIRTVLRAVLQNCGSGVPEALCSEAFRCLARCISECYKSLDEYLEEIAAVSLNALGGTGHVAIQAVEVWTALAEHEFRLASSRSAADCKRITLQALPALLPAVLEALARVQCQSEDDDDGFDLSEAARACLEAVARLVGDACVDPVVAFLESNLRSPLAGRRRAAIFAFGCVQGDTLDASLPSVGPCACKSSSAGAKLIGPALPELLEAFRSGNFPVAEAAAWALGRTLQRHPSSVPDEAQATIFEICVQRLRGDPRLAVEVCFCLDGLVEHQAAFLPLEIFEPAVRALLDAAASATTDQARTALISSLTDVIGQSSAECVIGMGSVMQSLLSWAKRTSSPQELPDRLVACLRALTVRLGSAVTPYAEDLLQLCAKISESHYHVHACFDAETLRATGTLAGALGTNFQAGMSIFCPMFLTSLQNQNDQEGCMASLAAFRDVAQALGQSMDPAHALAAVQAVGTLLKSQDAESRLRAPAVLCLAAIGAALGPSTPELPMVLGLISEQAASVAAEASAERCAMGAEDARVGTPPPSPAGSSFSCARKGGIGRALPVPTASLPEHLEGQHARRVEVFDATLQAYEEIFASFRRGGAVQQLRSVLPSIIEFAYQRADNPEAGAKTLRLALRLVGAVANEFPGDFQSGLVREDSLARSSVCRLVAFGATCSSNAMRDIAFQLRQFLPSPDPSSVGFSSGNNNGSLVVS